MSFRTLGEFIEFCESKGDVKRITREVDWRFEITEIAEREVKQQGPLLVFENVRGARFPLAVNVLAATRRIEWALGRTARAVGAEIEDIFHALPPKQLADLWALRGSASRVLASRPARMGSGPAQEFSLGADLSSLPVLQLWPHDGGRFITFPLVFTEDPETHKRNLGLYRIHLYDQQTTGMHWQIGKGGGFHYHKAEKRGESLEVAVAVGADPATLLSGVAPLPEGIDELAFAGFLRGKPTRMARAKSLRMLVPADAEFVIEGIVPPGERRTEGPFGDHFGHYSHAAPFPVFHVKNVTHRKQPIFQASIVGKPPQEDKYMGEAVQDMFLGVLKVIHPEIVDLWAYFEAGFHNLLAVAVENRYAKEGMKTALGLMGTGQLSLTKAIVLVEGNVNPRDRGQVFEAIAKHFDPSEDFLLVPGVPLDTLDFTSGRMNLGSKMVIDAQSHAQPVGSSGGSATAAKPASDLLRTVPDPRTFEPRVKAWRLAWGGMLVVQVEGEGRTVADALIHRAEYAYVKLIAVVSPDVPLDDDDLLLWGIFTRFDCARDMIPAQFETRGAWTVCRGPMGIDATFKPGYPEPVANLPEVISRVDSYWGK